MSSVYLHPWCYLNDTKTQSTDIFLHVFFHAQHPSKDLWENEYEIPQVKPKCAFLILQKFDIFHFAWGGSWLQGNLWSQKRDSKLHQNTSGWKELSGGRMMLGYCRVCEIAMRRAIRSSAGTLRPLERNRINLFVRKHGVGGKKRTSMDW